MTSAGSIKLVEDGIDGRMVLELHVLFLQKFERLTERERDAMVSYMEHLRLMAAPLFRVTPSDLVKVDL